MSVSDSKSTILVVDDDTPLRRLLVDMLRRAGFAALQAATATDALAVIREHDGAIGLVVLDMVMPGMSGLDMANELGRDFPAISILYISGYIDSIAADVLSRCSPDLILLKPFTEETLLDRVHLLLDLPARREPSQAEQTDSSSLRSGTSG